MPHAPESTSPAAGPRARARPRWRTSVLLPVAMLALGVAIFGVSMWYASHRAGGAVREVRLAVLGRLVGAEAGALAQLGETGGPGAWTTAFGRLDSLPDLRTALLIGDDDRVRIARPPRWTGARLAETPWAGAADLVAATRRSARVEARASEIGPVWYAARLPGHDEVLLVEGDLRPLVSMVRRETRVFFLVVGLALTGGLLLAAMFLVVRVERPARRITEAAERFAAGDRGARTGLRYADDLGRAGQAFDRMADVVAATEAERGRHQRLLDGLLEAVSVGVLMVDRASDEVIYANGRIRELTGLPLAAGTSIDRLGNRIETAGGTLVDVHERPLRVALRTGRAAESRDMVLVRPDGTRVPVVVSARPVSLAGGSEPDAAVAVFQDRRELEHAFAELARSERRLSALLDALPVGVMTVDRATRTVLFANRRLDELGGVETPAGRRIDQVDGARERDDGTPYPIAELPIERVLTTGEVVEDHDLVFVQPDGTRVPVITTAHPVSLSGGPDFDAVVTVVQDRREMERAFAEIRVWEERYQSALQATGQTVYEWDLRDDHVRFSESLTAVFGYRPDEIDSNALWNTITHPDDLPGVLAEMAARRTDRRMFSLVYRVRHKDGRWRWVRDRGVLRFDAEGRMHSMIGAVDDVTEQRELEARFRQSQKMETVGTLAGGIAHDFNNQLTGVLGHLDLLRDELAGDDARQDHVRIARVAAERCAELTRGLLAFSRMLRGEPRAVDVNATLGETAALLRRVLPATIRLEVAPSPGVPPALVDPTQLQQVILNLCINARDAMPDGGRLRIATSAVRVEPGGAAGGADPGEYVRIAVEDEGSGIAPDVLPRIFEPFFTTKPVGSGTGLGLSMVYGIVTQHHGWVDVESTPGRGAQFRVHLPAAPPAAVAEAAAGARAPVAASAAPAHGGTVLVVDDEPMVREFAARLLTRGGFRVLQAGDGREALDRWAARQGAIDAVLLDLTMPGPPVREVVRELRRAAPGLRIVLTSGYAQDAAAVAEFAGLRFLPKPYTPDALLGAMRPPAEPGA